MSTPHDDLHAYLEDARGTLGLTDPGFDEYRASDDAYTSLVGLAALLEWSEESLETMKDLHDGEAVGYRVAARAAVAVVARAINESLEGRDDD